MTPSNQSTLGWQALAVSALGLIALLALPSAGLGKPVWLAGGKALLVLGLIGGSYVLVHQWLVRNRRHGREPNWIQFLAACSLTVVPALLAVLLVHPQFPRPLLLATLGLATSLLLATYLLGRHSPWVVGIAGLSALAGLGLQVVLGTGLWPGPPQPTSARTLVSSALYELELTSYRRYVPRPSSNQGGITLFGDRYLLTTGDGDLFVFGQDTAGGKLRIERLAYQVPLNRSEFIEAAGPAVNAGWFRVPDVLTQPTPRGLRVFATHHYWKAAEKCWVARVSALEGTLAELTSVSAPLQWATIFESTPCMPLSQPGEPVRFSGINNGGRLALLDPATLLVTVGDHELDGYSTPLRVSQDLSSSLGKIVEVNLSNGTSTNFSIGHRNPQGLHVSQSGAIWSTEHGPQGGDELNLVGRGLNYGWPLATFGTEYGANAWPVSETPGRHDGFELPTYAWIPSIGVSNLVEVVSPRFERWRGDLLVASLRGQALWRMHLSSDRVVAVEQIPIGERIRDLQFGHDGELVLWTDSETIHFIAPSSGAETGRSLYRVCAGCHVPPSGQASAVGPRLQGIVGRKIAADPGFEYSSAMRAMDGTWTEERLDQFLATPNAVVPGTSMQFTGVKDPESRKVLIEFLASPNSRLDVAPPVPE
jgi:cytochrome c2